MIACNNHFVFIMRYAGMNRRILGVIDMDKSFTDFLTGIEWTARIVKTGKKYGLDDCLVNDGGSLVEFYDGRYDHTEFGQFVARYNAGTIAGVAGGLDLCGYEANWTICARTMGEIRAWLFDPIFPMIDVI